MMLTFVKVYSNSLSIHALHLVFYCAFGAAPIVRCVTKGSVVPEPSFGPN
jgi:hypothetical protein